MSFSSTVNPRAAPLNGHREPVLYRVYRVPQSIPECISYVSIYGEGRG